MSQDSLFRQPGVLGMLAAFTKVVKGLGMDYFVIGAVARDIALSRIPGYKPGRATKDVDIAILVGSEQEFEKVKEALVATGEFSTHERIAIKLFYNQGIELDLLPFGEIEDTHREVRIEKPRPFILDMPGFKEVLPEAEAVTVEGVEMIVCSLEGIVLLKLFANANNPSRTKDITDIVHIIFAYFEISADMIFNEFADIPDLYSTDDIDYLPLISARAIGRVIAELLSDSPDLRRRVTKILEGKTPNRFWPEMAAGLGETLPV